MNLPTIPDGYAVYTVGNLWRAIKCDWHGPLRAVYAQAHADALAHADKAPLALREVAP